MALVKFKITSISPLLMHNPLGMTMPHEKFGKKKIPTPTEEAERSAYKDADGVLYIEAAAFRCSILDACTGRKIGKVAAKGRIQGSLFCETDRCLLRDPDTQSLITGYSIDTRRVVVVKAGIMRSRARVESWQTDVTFELDEEMVAAEPVEEVFGLAGRICGVLDYRPKSGAGKGGPFGRYRVELLNGAA